LAATIRGVLEDERLRTNMVERGRVRASELSWDRTAELTTAVYCELL